MGEEPDSRAKSNGQSDSGTQCSWTSVLFIQLVGLTDHEPNGLGPSAPEENLGADFWGFLAPSKANFWGLLAIDLGA